MNGMNACKLFGMFPDDDQFGNSDINASHEWGMPGVICPVCGETWANTGLQYPLFDLAHLPFERDYRVPRAVPLEEFNFLKRQLAAVLPVRTLIKPGTNFGPLVGKAFGRFGDFAWLNPWTPLLKVEAYAKLKAAGLRLPLAANHKLQFRAKVHDELVELQIEPWAVLANAIKGNPYCAACGYEGGRLPDRQVIERASIPDQVDLFRAKNFSTLILATEELVNATKDLGLKGMRFEEVTCID